jgi:hypothetical protein
MLLVTTGLASAAIEAEIQGLLQEKQQVDARASVSLNEVRACFSLLAACCLLLFRPVNLLACLR